MKNKTNSFLRRIREVRTKEEAFSLVDVMVGIIVVGLIAAAAMTMIYSSAGAKAKQKTPTPAPVTEPAPVVRSAPAAEFPWAIALGIGLSAILVVALVALVVWFVRKNKASIAVSKNNVAGWEKLITRHRELRMQWASYELDMAKLIDFPLMTDMREPATAALHKALKKAVDLEPENAKKMAAHPVVNSDFWNAVNDLDAAFHTAEQTAKKVAWNQFTPSERKSLATAKNLLALALDSGASPAERQAAYKRVFKELQGLIEIPVKARLEIESRHKLAIAA
jgi:hypothetical protein